MSMEKFAIGLWGCYFGVVAVICMGSAVAYVQSLRRVALNAALSALVSGFYVAAFLGLLPVTHPDSLAVILALVALMVSVVLTYLLLTVLGFLESAKARQYSLAGLVGVTLALLLSGWFLSAADFLLMSTVTACLLGLVALGAALRGAYRGDLLAWAVVLAIAFMLTAIASLSLIALDRMHASWWLQAVSALAATFYMGIMAWVLWSRYAYLIELHKLMAYGPSYDPVTRMRSHHETGVMVGAVFNSFRDKPQGLGIVVLSIANLYALEQLYGAYAVNHALFVCAGRLRRVVPGYVEMGRLGNDGFVLIMRNCKESATLVDMARAVQARLRRPVNLNTSLEFEMPGTVWAAELGVGVLMVSNPDVRGADAIAMGRRMSRTAISYDSRIAWFDHSSGDTVELPDNRLL